MLVLHHSDEHGVTGQVERNHEVLDAAVTLIGGPASFAGGPAQPMAVAGTGCSDRPPVA